MEEIAVDSVDTIHLDGRDARILEKLTAIDSMLGELEHRMAHAGAATNIARGILDTIGQIHSEVTGLIGSEFYGLDDLDDLGDPGDPDESNDDLDDSTDSVPLG
jgi:hypothetical protein